MTAALEEQIRCVRREVAMRHSAYPKWVQAGRLKPEEATREIAAMEAVLRTLEATLKLATAMEGAAAERKDSLEFTGGYFAGFLAALKPRLDS